MDILIEQNDPLGVGSTDNDPLGVGSTNNDPLKVVLPIFDCVKKVHTNASITSTTLVAKITNTKTYNFFSNNRFSYKDGTKLLMGSWYCDGGDNYSVKLDNGQTYSSKNKVWSEIPAKEPDKSQDQYGTNKAILLQRGKNNLKIAGSDAIIY